MQSTGDRERETGERIARSSREQRLMNQIKSYPYVDVLPTAVELIDEAKS